LDSTLKTLYKLAGSPPHFALAFGDEVEEKKRKEKMGWLKTLPPQTPFSPASGGVASASSLQA